MRMLQLGGVLYLNLHHTLAGWIFLLSQISPARFFLWICPNMGYLQRKVSTSFFDLFKRIIYVLL